MNQLSLAEEEAVYELYLEDQREALRKEGAEELRIEILRKLREQHKRVWSKPLQIGIETAILITERATR